MKLQKRIAAQILKCGEGRIRFAPDKLKEVSEAITTFDVKRLINKGIIKKIQEEGVSRSRAKHRTKQRRKGRQSEHGSRKGKAGARTNPKQKWIANVRAQRRLIKTLRDKEHINTSGYRTLYSKVKGGFFRSTSHIKLYIEEQNMLTRK